MFKKTSLTKKGRSVACNRVPALVRTAANKWIIAEEREIIQVIFNSA
ncbi:MAG: hypothetical protein LBJ89_02755 [Holosporales bacterium]|nr:hypothetical protein [Holosporales bacterium]